MLIYRLNNNLDTLTYNIVFSNLSSDVTGAHLHLGKKGESGTIVIDLSDSISGNTIKGEAYGVDITKALISAMIRGEIYVNVHTKNHTSGEIRGQLISALRKTYSFELCGQQETPSVTTIAMGLGVVSIDRDISNLHYKIIVDSLSSEITGAHFHKAKIGEPGDVVLPITFQDNAAFGFLGDTASAPMVLILAEEIAAENIYVNVHTTNNTGGEIRGQVVDKAICSQVIGVAESIIPGAQILVYPMPFANALTIEVDALKEDYYTISLFDMQGKQISKNLTYIHFGKNTLDISLDNGKAGLYMLQITDEKGRIYSQKLMRY